MTAYNLVLGLVAIGLIAALVIYKKKNA